MKRPLLSVNDNSGDDAERAKKNKTKHKNINNVECRRPAEREQRKRMRNHKKA